MVRSILSSEILAKPPERWSTSSSSTMVLLSATAPSPKLANDMCWEPLVAVRRIAAALRASEAFNSMIVHPRSLATALANVVLPTPGGPERMMPRLSGGFPEAQRSSHWRMRRNWASLPSISAMFDGRYFSVQSSMLAASLTHWCRSGAS